MPQLAATAWRLESAFGLFLTGTRGALEPTAPPAPTPALMVTLGVGLLLSRALAEDPELLVADSLSQQTGQ